MKTLRTTYVVVGGIFIASFIYAVFILNLDQFFKMNTSGERTPAALASLTFPFTSSTTAIAAATTASVSGKKSLFYSFNVPGVLEETSTAAASPSPYWFLDSGARLLISGGTGQTIQGNLAASDPWYREYAHANSVDSDDGSHPQNIFRLLTKSLWTNAREETWFMITGDHLSASPNRTLSNGLLLMSRYQDQDTLYYAGIRVDGSAVIKKKYRGTYYTLAQTPFLAGTYHPISNPTLLPHGVWIALRADTSTNSNGSVLITLYWKQNQTSPWTRLVSATDTGAYGNTPPITTAGVTGIRTDFMDVVFRDFLVQEL
ncbi:MAG TPA: hypothetical protein VM103_01110 [Candidatus Paceibacterota bacterium]|nr:hypothetical protein [Candidatus Paceibacterota bacterium]